ncbi:MAG: NTP transferase domain-containing protein [Patescibacteria group bacterium]
MSARIQHFLSGLTIIILAAGHDEKLEGIVPCGFKGLYPINGIPMYEKIAAAFLKASEGLAEVIVVAGWVRSNEEIKTAHEKGFQLISCNNSKSIRQSIEAGRSAATRQNTVIVTADLPEIDVAETRQLLAKYARSEAGIVYGVADEQTYRRQFSADRTWISISLGDKPGERIRRVTGINAVYVAGHCLETALEVVNKLFEARKNPFLLGWVLGIGIALRFGHQLLTRKPCICVGAIKERVFRKFGVIVELIEDAGPTLCHDLDKPEHFSVSNSQAARV